MRSRQESGLNAYESVLENNMKLAVFFPIRVNFIYSFVRYTNLYRKGIGIQWTQFYPLHLTSNDKIRCIFRILTALSALMRPQSSGDPVRPHMDVNHFDRT
jgi:hypothetical protein